jgi:hypothetical protein
MEHPNWRTVDSLPTGSLMHTLDAAIADLDLTGERFESDGGEHALLLPLIPLVEGDAPGVVVENAPSEAAEVLFVDPATAASALSLLAMLGRRAETVRVALRSASDTTGLLPDAGRVTVTAGSESPVSYDLFRADDRGTLRSRRTDTPKLGEGADVLEERSKWFQGREGGGPA